ncbi:MAG: hypothetical protein HY422_03265 [Candidatus Komeilibacteria bacterium]|nr:hypothetical protein [Candidatus Komeilibacteria bacterium]
MSDSDSTIKKLFLHEPAYATTHADIYVGGSSNPERSLQQLILIISYPRSKFADQSLLTAIIQQAVRAFEGSRHATPELTLEETLETLNIALPEIAPRRDPRWLASLTMLAAISDRGQLHFSSIGDIQAFLIQQASLTRVSEQQQFNPLKLFSHITSGLLDPGNAMLFTTPPLIDYISTEKIKKILYEIPPRLAEERLASLLTGVPPSVSFASVFIKSTTELDELAERGYRTTEPAGASETIGAQDTSFEELDTLRPHVPMRRMRRSPRWSPMPASAVVLRFLARALLEYLKTVYASLVVLTKMLWKLLTALISFRERNAGEHAYLQFVTARYQDFKNQLLRLPRHSRRILLLTALLVFILLHLVMVKGQYRQVQKVQSAFDETLALLAQKKEAANDAIIYNDEKAAEKFLMEIDGLLSDITPANKTQEDQIAGYLEDNRRDLNKIRHINDIPSPFVLADLAASGNSFNQMAYAADDSYLISSGSALSRWKDGTLTPVAAAPSAITRILPSGTNTFVTTADNALLRLSGSALTPATVTADASQKAITAAALYANNLYILDAGSHTIFKYNGTSSGVFSTGTVWGRDTLLAQTLDLTIDGNLYTLNEDGRIVKYLRGERVEFAYHEPSPRIGTHAKIYTTKDSNYLYVLDPDNKRVIILEKQGAIKDQFTSKEFTNLADLALLPDESSVAVLNGSKIYLIAITE